MATSMDLVGDYLLFMGLGFFIGILFVFLFISGTNKEPEYIGEFIETIPELKDGQSATLLVPITSCDGKCPCVEFDKDGNWINFCVLMNQTNLESDTYLYFNETRK